MDAIMAILTRRSKRKFTDASIPDNTLKNIIECGLRAPSSKNAQPWRFHIVRSKEINQKARDFLLHSPKARKSVPIDPKTGKDNKKYKPTVIESAKILYSAPVVIYIENLSPFMGGRKNVIHNPYIDKIIHGYEFEFLGIGAAIENILIAANAYHLGSVFMGDIIIEEENIKQLLGIKGDLVGAIAVGNLKATKLWNKPFKEGRVIYHSG